MSWVTTSSLLDKTHSLDAFLQMSKTEVKNIKETARCRGEESALWLNLLLSEMWMDTHEVNNPFFR